MSVISIRNGLALVDGDFISSEMDQRGLSSDLMLRDIVPLLHPGDWIIDAGAAMGDHTGAYLNAVGDTGQVFAFEPNPSYFHCLQHNCPRAIHIKRPLWNSHVYFYLHSPLGNQGGGFISLSSESTGEFDAVSGPFHSVVVDDLQLDRLDYVKLDIEGAEFFALQGMTDTIKRCHPKFVIEMNPGPTSRFQKTAQDVYQLLDSLGYDHRSIRNEPQKYCTSCDILAWHVDHPPK